MTAVELMPVHQIVHDEALVARGLRNYWGYQTIGYFAPHDGYAAARRPGAQVRPSSRRWSRALHAAGIEVILDVVFNHTAEGDQDGPTLCLRGIDNATYYRLRDDPRLYVDDTGCGNTLDIHRPQTAAAGDGLAALLGAGDARRRLPLRPRGRPRPGRQRLRPPLACSSRPSARTRCSRG